MVLISIEILISALLSAGLMGLAAWAAIKVEVAKITQRIDDQDKATASEKEHVYAALKVQEQTTRETAAALENTGIEKAEALSNAAQERHLEYCRRFDRIEKRVGVTNGDGYLVSSKLFSEIHKQQQLDFTELRVSVRAAIEQGQEAVRVGHEDREKIKERLVKVETLLTLLTKGEK
jgi:hypothetical protein